MKEKIRKKIYENRYLVCMILFLALFHIICNLNIKTISFSSDEYIPLSIAAKYSGLDWMNSRNFNYYYGYITLLFFIPIFKLPFIYKNAFLLTQTLLGINSIFHILATVIIYLSVCMLFEKKNNEKLMIMVSLISSCSLQVFNVSMGIQIEALFVLAYAICFYCIVKLAKNNFKYYDVFLLSFFSYVSIANNSRGYVLLISIFMCMTLICLKERVYIKHLGCFLILTFIFLSIHKYVINPEYSKFFASNSYNTSSQPLMDNLKLLLSDTMYLNAFIKAFFAWMWSCNFSTFGLFFIAIFTIFKEIFAFFKEKEIKEIIIPLFILLNVIGISILCITVCINGIVSSLYGGLGNRADLVFYVRYFVGILTIADVYALYGVIEKKVISKKSMKILYISITILSSIAFIYYIGIPISGKKYGVNNSVFISLFLKGFDENYRYGNINSNIYIYMVLFIIMVSFFITVFSKNKKVLISVLIIVTFVTCLTYSFDIAKNKSDFYRNIFNSEIIKQCENYKNKKIYVSDHAPILQYNVADAKIYYKFDNQDLVIINKEKEYLLDESKYQYEYLATYDQWRLFKKTN